MLLDGKVAVVTGGARGTGAAIVRRFADEGAVVAATDLLVDEGEALAAGLGPRVSFHEADVTDEAAWARLVGELVAAHGRLDVLVNNAAILHLGGLDHTSAEQFRRVFDVNTAGAFLGIKAVVAAMRANGGGSIVNIASIDALQGMNGLSAYTTSKWALRGLTKAAAIELGPDDIRVNTVCPAGGNPMMYAPWGAELIALSDGIGAYHRKRAMAREVTVDEIADAALFLASDLSRMVTGVDLPVDGGHVAGDHVEGFDTL